MVNDAPSEPAATNVPLKTKATFGLQASFECPCPWLSVVVVDVELSLPWPCPSSASANEAPAPATNSARAIAFSFMRLKMPGGWHSCHPPGEDHPFERVLLQLDGGAGLFELRLDRVGFLLVHALLDRLRSRVDEVLGLLEAQA